MKTLMLWPDASEDFPSIITQYYSDCVEVKSLYKKAGRFKRAIRKAMAYTGLSTELFLDSWKKQVNEYELIIIHANLINIMIPSYLRNIGFKGRIIYWFWNPVLRSVNPNIINKDICELWSFDKEDCKKYSMKYNSTYYFGRMICKNSYLPATNLAFFIGRDKERYNYLKKLEFRLNLLGCKTEFLIIRDHSSRKNGSYCEQIDYKEVINKIKMSKYIVDVSQKGQSGLSLRSMESLFFMKKYITTNAKIRDEAFFKKSNIYILNDQCDNNERLSSFLELPYSPVQQNVIEYYDFYNWLKRFNQKD